MISKTMKKAVSLAMSLAVVTGAVAPVSASAAGTRTKPEAFGDDTYKNRFLSLYDDVVTNGQENGYLSKNNVASGGFGVPYHAVETMIVEAPDYGHETTSEAMSYIVWVAAMRDILTQGTSDASSDLSKAWKTMEIMIPTQQSGFWANTPSATYSPELDTIEEYATDEAAMVMGNTATNPIWKNFTSAYSSDKGLYLMHWLADVDNWYGYGSGTSFTLINTFQRGAMESCWETVPHPCVEELKYGNPQQGIKGIFKAPNELTIAAQWSYTNAPDAEDRAIQAVYAANRWGVGDSSVTTLAAKMGDELRNNMFDKYYKKIAVDTDSWSPSTGYESAHYLRNWYTSWGGAIDGSWTWQIGCSHCHEFYQNPLAAYALLADDGLKSGMKAENAVKDYETSLARQLEFYLWLQASNGPIAGGATNSNRGRYAPYSDGILNEDGSTTYVTSTFYDMLYVEHPVYLDPGSNHWIGNQVWATQRLAELYYYVKTDGDASKGAVKPGGLTIEDALSKLLDRWVAWFVENTTLTDDGDYAIPATLDWSGQPATWTGTYDENANSGLTCTVTATGSSDLGCVSSLANTLIYYAKAVGTKSSEISADATS
ncbi:MAG TPA: cellulose 1,4-beta-cellobiosidase, partial [Ruminococcus sp.]|nr:cellulose 1,4-beta-cellobiosidase [Ruminococcus sp.]